MTCRRWLLPVVVLAMCVMPAASAFAQTDEDHFQTFPFNFSNPGARSQAMGGAFIGLADDASAAVANPAGLTNLTRKQVYFEYKNLDAPVVVLPLQNSLAGGPGLLKGEVRNVPSFINFAMPLNDKITIAVSEHQFLSYKNSFLFDPRRTLGVSSNVFPATSTGVEMSGFSFSGAIGMTVNPKFKVGAAVSANRLSVDIDTQRNISACTSCAVIPSTQIHDSSMGAGITAGALFAPNDKFNIGAMYAYYPTFKVDQSVTGNVRYPGFESETGWTVPLKTPPRFGAGVSYREGRVLGSLDVVFVQYSKLADFSAQNLVLFRHFETSYRGVVPAADLKPIDVSQFTIKDGTDVHGGIELNVHRGQNPIFLRYGASKTSPHTLTFGEEDACGTDIHSPAFGTTCSLPSQLYFLSQSQRAALTTTDGDNILLGKSEIAFHFGGGIVIGRRTQIDAAYLRSNYLRSEFVLSSAIRF